MSKFCVLRAILKSTILKKVFSKKHDFEEKNVFKKHDFEEKINFKKHDFEWKSFCRNHDFQLNFFRLVRFWIKLFSSSHILDKKLSRLVKFRINFFTTRQILNNFPKSTTCTFHIVFLQITMCNYNPQYLLQLDDSIRHCPNNTFCTLFRKDFHFWCRYGVPLSSLNLLDICKNYLLLKVKLHQLIQF